PKWPAEVLLNVTSPLCRQPHELRNMRHRQQIVVRKPLRAGPAQVVRHERSIEPLRQPSHAIQILGRRRFWTEQIQSDAMQHDRVTLANPIEVIAWPHRFTQEVFTDDFEVVEFGPRLTEFAVVARPESESKRISGERTCHTARLCCSRAPAAIRVAARTRSRLTVVVIARHS